jgi:hypothetical protein
MNQFKYREREKGKKSRRNHTFIWTADLKNYRMPCLTNFIRLEAISVA